MKSLPTIIPSPSSDAVLLSKKVPTAAMIAAVKETEAAAPLKPNAVFRFNQRLDLAEDEARSYDEAQRVAHEMPAPRRTNPTLGRVGGSGTRAGKVAGAINYEYDTQAVDKEIVSNVEEVQRFNKELVVAEAEAQSINNKWNAVNPELQMRHPDINLDPGRVLDLITSIVEVVREPLMILDNALCIQKANRAFYRTFGLSEEDTESCLIYDLSQGAWNIAILKDLLEKVLLDNRAYEEVEVEVETLTLGRKALRVNVRRLTGGEMILMSVRDVTPRRRTEVELNRVQDELRHGQKMEVIGRLAGGVAHDFNNILTAVLGFSEILLDRLEEGTDVFHYAGEIKKASERAAALTQQLLAFSRRQVLRPRIVCLNTVILGLNEMLQRLPDPHLHTLARGRGPDHYATQCHRRDRPGDFEPCVKLAGCYV